MANFRQILENEFNNEKSLNYRTDDILLVGIKF